MKIKELDEAEESAVIKASLIRIAFSIILGISLGANVVLGIVNSYQNKVLSLQNEVLKNEGLLEFNKRD
tara:strand:+ start:374 stop:580 length:207 start_codon:yes stop_codon:yes gene_type:complete